MVSDPAAYADLSALVADFRNARRMAKPESEKVLDKVGKRVEILMRQYAPKDTGRLSQSIRMLKEPGRRTISPVGVEYAVYQEFGTGIRGEFPAGMIEIKKGTQTYKSPGVRPQPFARPAARDALETMVGDYLTLGVTLITQGKS